MNNTAEWYENYYDEVGKYKLQEEQVTKREAEVKRSSHTPLLHGATNTDKKVK